MDFSEATRTNLEWLKTEKGFTVTTGHQLSLFTGPLFFCYKIIHTIRLAEELNKGLNEHHVVPVFWMASEDHDFEEMHSIQLFQKAIGVDQNLGGAFGRYPSSMLNELKEQVGLLFRNTDSEEITRLLNSYEGETIVEATQALFHHLFGDYGLVVLNPDNKELKQLFTPCME